MLLYICIYFCAVGCPCYTWDVNRQLAHVLFYKKDKQIYQAKATKMSQSENVSQRKLYSHKYLIFVQ